MAPLLPSLTCWSCCMEAGHQAAGRGRPKVRSLGRSGFWSAMGAHGSEFRQQASGASAQSFCGEASFKGPEAEHGQTNSGHLQSAKRAPEAPLLVKV